MAMLHKSRKVAWYQVLTKKMQVKRHSALHIRRSVHDLNLERAMGEHEAHNRRISGTSLFSMAQVAASSI
jgi:hypothetical protein